MILGGGLGLVGVVLVPGVDHDHVAFGQPHGPVLDVVEDDAGAVDAEEGVLGGGQALDARVAGQAGLALTQRRARGGPGAVRAALVEGGRGRGTRDGDALLRGGHRGGGAVEGDAHQGVRCRQEHGGRGRPGHLEDRAGCKTVGVEGAGAPARQDERVGRRIVDDGFITHGGDRQVVAHRHAAEGRLGGGPRRARTGDRGERGVLRRVGEDSAAG